MVVATPVRIDEIGEGLQVLGFEVTRKVIEAVVATRTKTLKKSVEQMLLEW